ncbi:DNA cytosine methyltransferase [Streptomyces rimosus]|uniref:DNA cytosine methyltransferase n=1 Tax=Streptomyces rimosus TaxID=1927 RepID=UPI0005187DB4|nr:DNA cytosine methyltransferase [Streptomyces rimosus]
MSGLRIGSLCTGYGGLDMAVQAVFGGAPAWVADNDPGAARILAHHLPRVANLGDITAVDWNGVEPVDIVCGGYPCQPFSTAGKRKGIKDARHIWPHIARALGVLRPRYAVFENVAGHLSLGFDTVLSDLAALGLDARWCTLRASDVGAAHQRKRLFLLAWPADTQGTGREGEGVFGRPSGRGLTAADTFDLGGDRHGPCGSGRDEPAARCLAAAHSPGISQREPADQALPVAGGGEARPEPGGRGLRTAADAAGNGRDEGRTQPARQQGGSDTPLGSTPGWGPYAAAVERWEAVIGRPAPRPVDALGRLNPPLVEWLMGLPAGHVTAVPGLSRTAQLKALGNGVVPQQASAALRHLLAPVEHGHRRREVAA